MKLYTEEQVRKQKQVLEDIIDLWDEGLPLDSHTVEKCKYALYQETPIELPSDEDIEKEIQSDVHINSDTDFFNGAKWVIEEIKKQK